MKMKSQSVGLLIGSALLVSSLVVVAAPGAVDNGVWAEKSRSTVAGEKGNTERSSEGKQSDRKYRVRMLDDSDERARPTEEEDHNH